MKLRSLEDLMVAQLKILRGAEEHIVSNLPKYAACASAPEVVAALEAQVAEAAAQRTRLTRIAEILDKKLSPRTSDPVEGMLEEMRILTMLKKTDPQTLDIALLSASQRLLRHRMNAYRHAHTLAEENGSGPVAELLDEALAEQSAADAELTKQIGWLIKPPVVRKIVEASVQAIKPSKLRRPADVVDRLLGVDVPRSAADENVT